MTNPIAESITSIDSKNSELIQITDIICGLIKCFIKIQLMKETEHWDGEKWIGTNLFKVRKRFLYKTPMYNDELIDIFPTIPEI